MTGRRPEVTSAQEPIWEPHRRTRPCPAPCEALLEASTSR